MQHLLLPRHLLFQLTGIFPMACTMRLLKLLFFQQHYARPVQRPHNDLESKCRFLIIFPAANGGCAAEMPTVAKGVLYERTDLPNKSPSIITPHFYNEEQSQTWVAASQGLHGAQGNAGAKERRAESWLWTAVFTASSSGFLG